ncbi:MAG TPA: serine/threonine-protein kinase [Pyrinomonadaceae bacterium]|jgi:serine/threonine protein kinase
MGLAHLNGQVLDGKYRIEKELGKGGMGAVYLATHLGTERPVALKVIAPQFMKHEEFVERFKREARAAGRLRHPNVVDVTDFGFARTPEQERVAYLVMEYLDGCTLAEILSEESRLPLAWVIDILEQVCSAVDEAHQQGIIHRDLKPDNIWLEPNRRGGYTVKVLDFGIAKLADASVSVASSTSASESKRDSEVESSSNGDSEVESDAGPTRLLGVSTEADTQIRAAPRTRQETATSEASTLMQTPEPRVGEDERTRMLADSTTSERAASKTASTESLTRVGSILGTPLYMSPEQCRGASLDARSDIYNLGVIAYQMLSGRTPFAGDFDSVMRQHAAAEPPPLREKKIPRKVAAVVMSALAKNPSERPPSATAFSSALRAHSEGASVLLRRALALYSEHLPIFLRTAFICYAPLLCITTLQLVVNALNPRRYLPVSASIVLSIALSLISMLVSMVMSAVLMGVTTRLVTQLLAAPLRPINLRSAFDALRRRWRPFIFTATSASLLIFLGLFLGVVPGLVLMVNYSLIAPALMMENVRGRAAMRRARQLAARARRTVVLIILIQVFAPILISGVIAFSIISLLRMMGPLGGRANLFASIYQFISMPILVVVSSLSTIISALLYLKTRQAGGETLKDALGEFADEERPRRRWQIRMRERLHLTTRLSR